MRNIKVYVAGSFDHAKEINTFADILRRTPGVEITSHWLQEPPLDQHDYELAQWHARVRCNEDVIDLERSDVLVLVSWWPSTKGGMHAELGMAIAHRMPILLVGPEQNFFYNWSYVKRVDDAQGVIDVLEELP